MFRPVFALLASLTLVACTPETSGTTGPASAQVAGQVIAIRGHISTAVGACSALLGGQAFPTSKLKASGFQKAAIGNSLQKRISKGTFANPNGTFVQVGQTRKGSCTLVIAHLTNLQIGVLALTQELAAQGWSADTSGRKRVYRKGGSALVIDGGSYSSVVTFSLDPA